MGIYNNGILGAFSGLVGSVVGSSFRGHNVMRSRPRKSNKPASLLQIMQRTKFAKAISFLTPAKMILSDYFGAPTGVKSRFNLAVAYHLVNAIGYVNGVATVLYDKLVYAKGSLLAPQNLVCVASAGAQLDLTWINNSDQAGTLPSDQLMVVVVEVDSGDYEFFLNAAERIDVEAKLNLPAYLAGTDVHVYAFMAAEDGKSNSTSQHLGKFTLL
ncbi:DUF6266 family protein [Flavobacterium sp. SM2513]|uniref:DUF6266 family protein n=1 Tax=Flavobacterium sp. SM2513 TaxID=3424766 RepID=UPI003D7F62A1